MGLFRFSIYLQTNLLNKVLKRCKFIFYRKVVNIFTIRQILTRNYKIRFYITVESLGQFRYAELRSINILMNVVKKKL